MYDDKTIEMMEQDEADSTLKATDIKEKEEIRKSDAEKEDGSDRKSKDIEVIVSWPTIKGDVR